jgi:hypothetical protein
MISTVQGRAQHSTAEQGRNQPDQNLRQLRRRPMAQQESVHPSLLPSFRIIAPMWFEWMQSTLSPYPAIPFLGASCLVRTHMKMN